MMWPKWRREPRVTRAELAELTARYEDLRTRHLRMVDVVTALAGALQVVSDRTSVMPDVRTAGRTDGQPRRSIADHVRDLLATCPDMSIEELQTETGGSERHIRRLVNTWARTAPPDTNARPAPGRPIGFTLDDIRDDPDV